MSEIATQSLVPADITLGSGIKSHATALFMETTNVLSSLIEDGGTFSAESTTIIYDDDNDDDEAELIQAGSATFEVPFFVALLIFGGIGNLMVVAVYTRKKYKNSNAALHILNLAAGDLFLLIVVVGLHISEYYYQTWFILWRTDIQCILHRFARFVGFNLTVFEMMAIAIDRYLAVCFPLRFKAYCTPGQTKLKIFLLWILALLTAIPVVLNFATKYGIPLFSVTFVGKTPFACRAVSGFPEFYEDFKIIYISIILFFIPIVITAVIYVIIVAYVRSNNQKFTKINSYSRDTSRMRSHWKTARTLLAAFTCYAACYVLLATYTLVRQYSPAAITPTMKNIGLLLPYANSCMKPVVYSVVNRQFRRDFVALFPCVQGSSSTGNTRTDRGINGNTRTDRGINESTTIATTLPDDSGMNTASLSKETATTAAPCSSISYDVFVKETITKENDHGDRGVVHISIEKI